MLFILVSADLMLKYQEQRLQRGTTCVCDVRACIGIMYYIQYNIDNSADTCTYPNELACVTVCSVREK